MAEQSSAHAAAMSAAAVAGEARRLVARAGVRLDARPVQTAAGFKDVFGKSIAVCKQPLRSAFVRGRRIPVDRCQSSRACGNTPDNVAVSSNSRRR